MRHLMLPLVWVADHFFGLVDFVGEEIDKVDWRWYDDE